MCIIIIGALNIWQFNDVGIIRIKLHDRSEITLSVNQYNNNRNNIKFIV